MMNSTRTPINRLTLTEVYCSLQVEGTHCWPECPIPEVDYLRFPHRHMFHIKAYKKVSHSDRDVEFIKLKQEITTYIQNAYPLGKFGSMSCEMLAHELIMNFSLSRCDVSEDNENGAIVTVM